jgi:serine/threonine protein kinase
MAMNPNYTEFKFPQIKPHPWPKVFRTRTSPDAIDLISQLLQYDPEARIRPLEACCVEFFEELRDQNTRLSNSKTLPDLFNFTTEESNSMTSELKEKLIPKWYQASR